MFIIELSFFEYGRDVRYVTDRNSFSYDKKDAMRFEWEDAQQFIKCKGKAAVYAFTVMED